MKTIFIPIFQGVEAKNILRTDIFRILRSWAELRIVLILPNKRKEGYFGKEFAGNNLVYEIFNKYRQPRFNRFFSFLKYLLLNTRTMDLRRKEDLGGDKKHFKYLFLQTLLNRIFACRFWRRIVRWLDWKLIKDDNFIELFDKYNPDLVFLADLFGDLEISILREAKKRKIKSIGLINSWDKITSRCVIRLLPDKLIVHNNIMKKEAIKYVDMQKEDITVVGIPHYDVFVNSKPRSREEFCKKIGLEPNKRFITFCPLGKRYSDIDVEFMNVLLDFKDKDLIPKDIEILVRFPPNDFVDFQRFSSRKDVALYQPGVRFSSGRERRIDWDMNDEDIQILYETLFYTSLLVCQASTLTIDASVFDKPIINFYMKSKQINPPRDGSWIHELTHYQPILKSGGVRKVGSREEFLEWINKYLDNPQLDAEGRKRITEEQCWRLDGKSGERVAKLILNALHG